MSRREPRTLLEVVAMNVGLLKAGRALAIFVMWGWCSDRLGHWATAEEYSARYLKSEAQAFRDQALIRVAFGGPADGRKLRAEDGPLPLIWAAVRQYIDVRASEKAAAKAGLQVGMAPAGVLP